MMTPLSRFPTASTMMSVKAIEGTRSAQASGIIVLALFVYLGYHIAYVRPGKRVEQIQQQLTETRQRYELQALVVTSLHALEQKRARFAERPDADWLLQEIGQLAKAAGLEVRAVTPFPAQTLGDVTLLRVSLEFTTTYHGLGHFLSRLESHPRFLEVDDLNLTAQGSSDGKAQVRLTVSALYMPTEIIVPTSPTPQAVATAHGSW